MLPVLLLLLPPHCHHDRTVHDCFIEDVERDLEPLEAGDAPLTMERLYLVCYVYGCETSKHSSCYQSESGLHNK